MMNELNIIVIPIRELLNAFLVTVTSVLYINIQQTNSSKAEKPNMQEYMISRIGGDIDDSEIDFDYQEEFYELICPGCGTKLVEFYEICPDCSKDISQRSKDYIT